MFTLEALFGLVSLVAFLAAFFVLLQRLGAREVASLVLGAFGLFFVISAAISGASMLLGGP